MEIPLNTTLEGLADQLKQPVLHMEDYQYQHLDGMYFMIVFGDHYLLLFLYKKFIS